MLLHSAAAPPQTDESLRSLDSGERVFVAPSATRGILARLPLLLLMVLLGGATFMAYLIRLTEPAALTPWEPAIAMEAVRLNAGLPVYESAHATHMYGPLLTVALAGIFKVTGLNV